MSKFALSPRARQISHGTILSGLAVLLCLAGMAEAQKPPKAVPVEEETDPGPAPAPKVPKAIPVPDAAPEPATPRPRPAAAVPRAPASPAAAKSPEDDLFDYCELLYSKANYGLA